MQLTLSLQDKIALALRGDLIDREALVRPTLDEAEWIGFEPIMGVIDGTNIPSAHPELGKFRLDGEDWWRPLSTLLAINVI